MGEDLISSWTPVRIDPDIKGRIEAILSRAGDRTSVTKIVNALLSECVAQIESVEPSPPAMLTVHRLRNAIGHATIATNYDSVMERVSNLESTLHPALLLLHQIASHTEQGGEDIVIRLTGKAKPDGPEASCTTPRYPMKTVPRAKPARTTSRPGSTPERANQPASPSHKEKHSDREQ